VFHIPLGRLPNLIYIDVMASLIIASSFSDDLFTGGASLVLCSLAPEKRMTRPVKYEVRGVYDVTTQLALAGTESSNSCLDMQVSTRVVAHKIAVWRHVPVC
jgi:hypothetical protein